MPPDGSLLERANAPLDEVIDVTVRATIEAVLRMRSEVWQDRRSRAGVTPTGSSCVFRPKPIQVFGYRVTRPVSQ